MLGYGRIRFRSEVKGAHRVSYELNNGPIPVGMHVMHSCDQPSCVNPDHLFVGTNRDNHLDKLRKQRQARGMMLHRSRMTHESVRRLRHLAVEGVTQKALAERFDLVQSSVWAIINRRSWKHID